jgi:hypothetical protein
MIFVTCPHCNCLVYVEQVNCKIFRHGTFKHNYEPIPPHSPKSVCDKWIEEDAIWGCGKPFRIELNEENQWVSIICDYI